MQPSRQNRTMQISFNLDIMPFPASRLHAVNVATVPQRSPLRYPGGKTWLIPHIREWLGSTNAKVLIEPFAGGGIVSLTAVMEGLVDQAIMVEIDRDVAAFWHTVLRDGATLRQRVKHFTPTRKKVMDLERKGIRSVEDHGFRTLVLNRTKRAGILALGASLCRSGENGKGLLSRWYPDTLALRIGDIERFSDRITFMEGDGTRLLNHLLPGINGQGAVFVDPPYTTSSGKRAGNRLYTHNKIDHAALFDTLSQHPASFLMTYDAAPDVINLVHKHEFHAVCVTMKNAHHNRLPELVITRERLFA